jgi:LETM1-like protein
LKARLGLDAGVGGVGSMGAMDWGSLGVVVSEGVSKIKVGLSFYGEGTKLLMADVQYASTLLAKAISGSTLKPREVNTVRRTGKDLLTLVPFTVILLIPLSPVGHVLVFSFIQVSGWIRGLCVVLVLCAGTVYCILCAVCCVCCVLLRKDKTGLP